MHFEEASKLSRDVAVRYLKVGTRLTLGQWVYEHCERNGAGVEEVNHDFLDCRRLEDSRLYLLGMLMRGAVRAENLTCLAAVS